MTKSFLATFNEDSDRMVEQVTNPGAVKDQPAGAAPAHAGDAAALMQLVAMKAKAATIISGMELELRLEQNKTASLTKEIEDVIKEREDLKTASLGYTTALQTVREEHITALGDLKTQIVEKDSKAKTDESEIARLTAAVAALTEERDALQTKVTELTTENERLSTEVNKGAAAELGLPRVEEGKPVTTEQGTSQVETAKLTITEVQQKVDQEKNPANPAAQREAFLRDLAKEYKEKRASMQRSGSTRERLAFGAWLNEGTRHDDVQEALGRGF